MNISNNVNLKLNHITSLSDSCNRVRKGENAARMSLGKRISLFFKDLFTGGCKATDNEEYNRYSSLIKRQIRVLKNTSNESDEFYKGIKTLLHVDAKITYTGWAKSLKNNIDYNQFKADLKTLQDSAKQSVKQWSESETQENSVSKAAIKRWIEADDIQLHFAGYSNEIVYKAEEIPVGAVLLSNPEALKIRDKIKGYGYSLERRIQVIKGFFCKLFTQLPVTHAMASLGGGEYIHIDNKPSKGGKLSLCAGQAKIEDFTPAKQKEKGKTQYMFGYEVLLPNHAEFAEQLNCKEENIPAFFEKWSQTIRKSAEDGATPTSPWNIISTVFGSNRPKDYDITKIFDPQGKGGYSCSGLICSSLAKHGVDIVKHSNKRVNKAAPSDFAKTRLYDLDYSNNRKFFAKIRDKALAEANKDIEEAKTRSRAYSTNIPMNVARAASAA